MTTITNIQPSHIVHMLSTTDGKPVSVPYPRKRYSLLSLNIRNRRNYWTTWSVRTRRLAAMGYRLTGLE